MSVSQEGSGSAVGASLQSATPSSSNGFRVLGWNIGGADLHQLSKAILDGSGSHLGKNDLMLLQELPRSGEGWTYMQISGRRLVGHREGSQWRGTGLWYDERAWCVLRKLGTRKGTWFKLRHLEYPCELWLGTAHFSPGCPVQKFEEEAADHFGGLPRAARKVVFQGDVNTGFTWQADEGEVTAVAKEGKGGVLHQTLLEHQLRVLPPGPAFQHLPTSRPRQEDREGQCIDVFAARSVLPRGVWIHADSFMCLGTDHELLESRFAFAAPKNYCRHASQPRVWRGHLQQIDHIDQDVLESLAKSHTKPKPGTGYRDSKEVKAAFAEAKRQGTAQLWKNALKLRKEARRKWEWDRLQRASQGDWGSFRALKRPKQEGWDVGFAEHQQGDPHVAVHEHLTSVYDGEEIPAGETWRGEIEAFTVEELRVGLGHMKQGKSVGVDGTSVELLQGVVAVPGGEGHLLEYFNRVLVTQEIPSKWNEPLLIMIPKVAAPTLPKHLRPIAMSSAVGKLFARLLLNRALPRICPTTYAQCAGKHRQTADYLYTVFRTLELCREWGHPLAMFKLDLEKAFDRLDRPALLRQLEAKLGPGAELQCWRGLLRTTKACLQTPWGSSTVEMKRGIKQGSVESPSFFGHITEIVLAMAVASPQWQEHQRVLEGMEAEEMLFVDDGVLWTRSCRAMEARVGELVRHLSTFGLSLNPLKCQLYVSKNVQDGGAIRVGETQVRASKAMEVMGISMYVGISIYELISPLTSRARAKFWELRHIFRCKTGMKGRVRVMQRVVGATALWCLCSFPPDAAAMSLLNATQLQLMVWLLRFSKKESESWTEYRQRSFRGARSALHNSGVERWSTMWLRRWWSFAGHRVRGMLAPHPVISSLYEDFRTGPWWQLEKQRKDGLKHCQHYPRLSNLETKMNMVAGAPWRTRAHDRKGWKQLEDKWVELMDLPWASGRQLSVRDL